MEEWKEYRISDICTGIYEGPHATPKESQTGAIYLGIPAISEDGHINFKSAKRIAEEDLPLWTKRVTPQKDDIVFTNEATLNLYAMIPEGFHGCLGRRLGLVRPNKDIVNAKYLFYYFFSPEWRNTISQNKVYGATVERILMTKFPFFPVKLPNKSIQNKIVDILSSFDDKIEVNRRLNDNFTFSFLLLTCFVLWLLKLINDNLLLQARALYKSWFIDFEPFKDGEFEDSELGMIPHGWSVKQLGEITTQVNEKVKERVDVKVLSPITTGELVLSEEYFTKQVFSESISKYIVVKPTEFAYNPARVNIGSLGMNEYGFDGCVSPVYVVFRCEDEYQYFFDLFRRTETFKEEVKARAIGGVRQSLNYKDFSLIKVVYPPIDVIHRFNQIYLRILAKTKHNDAETSRLASIRDTLLPKLMSGELKIS